MLCRHRVVCIGEDVDSSYVGELMTMIPIEMGQVHTIKDRQWSVSRVSENGRGEPLIDFVPYATTK